MGYYKRMSTPWGTCGEYDAEDRRFFATKARTMGTCLNCGFSLGRTHDQEYCDSIAEMGGIEAIAERRGTDAEDN